MNVKCLLFILVFLTNFYAFGSYTAGFEFIVPDDYHFFTYDFCNKCCCSHFVEYRLYEGVDEGYYYLDLPLANQSVQLTFALSKLCRDCQKYCTFSNKDTFPVVKDKVHFINMTYSSGFQTSEMVQIMSLSSGGNVYTSSYQNNSSTNQTIKVLNYWCEEYAGNTNSNGGLILMGVVPECAATNAVMTIELPPEATYVPADLIEGGSYVFNVSIPNISKNDNDRDGLSFDEEYTLGTCDNKSDTDGDGIEDKVETAGAVISLNVLGKSPKTILAKTKPAYFDTDRDGRSDLSEVMGIGGFVTDPNDPDCDKDGVPDGFDPDPLTAFTTNENDMPSAWVDFWRGLGEKAEIPTSVLTDLQNPASDCNGDEYSNAQELLHGRQPIFSSDFFKLSFGDVSRVYTNGILNLNFYTSIYAPHSITGAVLISRSNWSEGTFRGYDNYDLYDFLPDFPEFHVAPFVATLGLSNKFNFSITQHSLNGLTATNEKIRVYILDKGWLSEQKPIYIYEVSPDVEGNVSPPVLLSPLDNVEYLGEENTVTFQWDTNALTSLWSLSVVEGGDFIDIDRILTTGHSFTTNLCLPSKYYWNVSSVSTDGKLVRSGERHVIVRWPEADTDYDGFMDGYEFEHGSDWNDAESVPVIMQGNGNFSSAAGLLVSISLNASSGVPPYKWKLAGGKLPLGLKLMDNAIQGIPQIEGRYTFRLRLSDALGSFQLIDCVYEVTAEREKTLKKLGPIKFIPSSNQGGEL